MIGQGRPSSFGRPNDLCARAAPLARAAAIARHAFVAIALILCAFLDITAAAQETTPVDPIRLRISWGGGEDSRWFGRVRLENGSLANLQLLGTAADSAGSMWLQDGALHVASISPRKLDSVELAATGAAESQLLIEISDDPKKPPTPIKVPLADVQARPYSLRLDDRGNTLQLQVIPNETLQISTDRQFFIFSPGEQFSFDLQPAMPEAVPGTTLDIHTTLSPARGSEILWSDEQRLAVPVEGPPAVVLNVPLPRAEGVYTIRASVSRPSGFRQRFFPGANAPLAQRNLDVVVLARSHDPRLENAAPAEWQKVWEVDPTSARWWERQVRRIPRFNLGPLGSLRAGAVDLPLGRFVELPPTIAGAEPHWQAYSLPVEAAGVPHLLEIDYPADDEQHFGISIVEPNAGGIVEGIGRDGGVYVEGLGLSESATIQTHRTVFWPRTQAPLLVVTNQHPTAAAHFRHIRLLKRSANRLVTEPADDSNSKRLVAAYIARPRVAETFGASKSLGASTSAYTTSASTDDDWQILYESATRLADYVCYAGYNSAIVSTLADGSSLYPSARLLSTASYDSDRAAANATEQDGLELMLRVFDREQLAFIPALQFAVPIPALEELRRGSDPQTSGLEWIGPNGQTWLAMHGTANGLAPYYNLLDPRVQREILQFVHELLDRYGQHPSLTGLAIQLSANGYAQLPPLEWGLDDATIARFQRDTGIQLDAAGPNRFATRHALVTGEHAEAWREWRASCVAEFYARLATLVRADRGDRRLLLTLEESFAHPLLAARIRPNILLPNRVETTLLDVGIHRELLEKTPGIVICPTRYVEPMTPLWERAVDLQINEAFAAWPRPADTSASSAALLYHRGQRQYLASFNSKSPFKIAGDSAFLFHPLAHGPAVRQPYVRTLIQNDPAVLIDGGEILPIGQEDELRNVRTILRQLPDSATVTDTASQPVIVRAYAEPDCVTLLAVNASPWSATADITLDIPQAAALESLADTKHSAKPPAPPPLVQGQQLWSLTLAPYGVEAVRIAVPGVKVVDVQAEPSEAAQSELAARLADLADRDLTAPRAYQALSNPSFEPVGAAVPPTGWRLIGDAATAELDATSPKNGITSLIFRNKGKFAAIESEPFPMPRTGQLAMTVHVRNETDAAGDELRMVFESTRGGQVYRRSAIVAPTPDAAAGEWQYKAILVNDLPLESRGEMRIRFELSGPGEASLDNVQLYELLFPLKFYKFEGAEIVQFLKRTHEAKTAFDAGRVTDVARMLDDYWLRFLTDYTPVVQPTLAAQRPPGSTSPPPADEGQQPAPGISERIKRVFPFVK